MTRQKSFTQYLYRSVCSVQMEGCVSLPSSAQLLFSVGTETSRAAKTQATQPQSTDSCQPSPPPEVILSQLHNRCTNVTMIEHPRERRGSPGFETHFSISPFCLPEHKQKMSFQQKNRQRKKFRNVGFAIYIHSSHPLRSPEVWSPEEANAMVPEISIICTAAGILGRPCAVKLPYLY